MKKRILPSILAVALLLSLAIVPTFASTAAPGTTVTGTYEAVTIAVDVPSTQSAAINPYGMPIDLKDTDNTVLATVSGQQVVTRPIYVVNKTTVPLYVGATVVTTTKGSFALSKTADISTLKTKTGYLYLQMAVTELDGTAMDTTVNTGNTAFEGYALKNSEFYPVFARWDQDHDAQKDLILVTGDAGAKGDKMMLLSAAEKVAATGTSGQAGFVPEHNEPQAGGIGMVRISGSVVEEPTEKWTASDGFTAKITYIFKPDTTTAKITTDKTAIDLSGSNDTATLTVNLTGGSEIDSVDWKLVDANGDELDDADKPVGVTLAQDGTDANKATLKVATGALKGPQNVMVTATVTRKDGNTFDAAAKTISVAGDTDITIDGDTDVIIGANGGQVDVALEAQVNGSAATGTVAWAIVTDPAPAGITLSATNTASINVQFADTVAKGTEVTLKATITESGKTYVVTTTLKVVDIYTATLTSDESAITVGGTETATLTVVLKNSAGQTVDIADVTWADSPDTTSATGVTFTGTQGEETATLTVATGASNTQTTYTITATVEDANGVTSVATATVDVTGDT